jgi:hypothetical protein
MALNRAVEINYGRGLPGAPLGAGGLGTKSLLPVRISGRPRVAQRLPPHAGWPRFPVHRWDQQ